MYTTSLTGVVIQVLLILGTMTLSITLNTSATKCHTVLFYTSKLSLALATWNFNRPYVYTVDAEAGQDTCLAEIIHNNRNIQDNLFILTTNRNNIS